MRSPKGSWDDTEHARRTITQCYGIWNSIKFVIASEAKQSLEILNSSLGNSRFCLGILEFPTMSSPSLTGGSLYGILDFYFIYSRNSRFGLGILVCLAFFGVMGYFLPWEF